MIMRYAAIRTEGGEVKGLVALNEDYSAGSVFELPFPLRKHIYNSLIEFDFDERNHRGREG